MAWLGLIEIDSILIREKHKHLSKMSDRVSRNVLEGKRSRIESRECFVEVYIDNQSIFIIVYSHKTLACAIFNFEQKSWSICHLYSSTIYFAKP